VWFDSADGREDSPWREFYEQLVRPGILSLDVFPYVFYRRLDRRMTPIRWAEHLKRHEFRLADIFELVPTPEQAQALRAVADGADVRWVTREQIERRGVVPNEQPTPWISELAVWTI
jgi:hypothetical protein